MSLSDKRKEKIQALCDELYQAEQVGELAQKKLDKFAGDLEQLLRAHPYGYDDFGRSLGQFKDLADHLAALKKTRWFKEDGYAETLAPHFQKWQELRTTARDAWQRVRELESEVQCCVPEVMDEFIAQFNARIGRMRAYLVKIYTPLCLAETEWERNQQMDILLQSTPRYQKLLLTHKYGHRGTHASGQITSMLSALSQLESSLEDERAVYQLK